MARNKSKEDTSILFHQRNCQQILCLRESINTTFNKKKIEEKVADTGIQQILLRHLEQNGNNPEQASHLKVLNK